MITLWTGAWLHASVQFADERVVVKSSALVNAHEECWTKFQQVKQGRSGDRLFCDKEQLVWTRMTAKSV